MAVIIGFGCQTLSSVKCITWRLQVAMSHAEFTEKIIIVEASLTRLRVLNSTCHLFVGGPNHISNVVRSGYERTLEIFGVSVRQAAQSQK